MSVLCLRNTSKWLGRARSAPTRQGICSWNLATRKGFKLLMRSTTQLSSDFYSARVHNGKFTWIKSESRWPLSPPTLQWRSTARFWKFVALASWPHMVHPCWARQLHQLERSPPWNLMVTVLKRSSGCGPQCHAINSRFQDLWISGHKEWIINRGEEMDPLKVRRLLKDGRCVGPVQYTWDSVQGSKDGQSTIGSTTACSVETHTSLHDNIKESKVAKLFGGVTRRSVELIFHSCRFTLAVWVYGQKCCAVWPSWLSNQPAFLCGLESV